MTSEEITTLTPELLLEIKKFYVVPQMVQQIDEPLIFSDWKLIPLLVDRPRKWRYPTLQDRKNVPPYDPVQPRAHDFPAPKPQRRHRRGKHRHRVRKSNGSGGEPCSS